MIADALVLELLSELNSSSNKFLTRLDTIINKIGFYHFSILEINKNDTPILIYSKTSDDLLNFKNTDLPKLTGTPPVFFIKGKYSWETTNPDVFSDGFNENFILHFYSTDKKNYYLISENHFGFNHSWYLVITEIIKAYLIQMHQHSPVRSFKEKYEKLLTNNPFAIVAVNSDGFFIDANEEWIKICGYSLDELLKIKTTDLIHPDDIPETKSFINDMINNKLNFFQQEKRIYTRDKFLKWIDLSVKPVYKHDGCLDFMIGTIKDITEHKKHTELINNVIKNSNDKTGRELFQNLVSQIAGILSADYVFIGEYKYDTNEIVIVAVSSDNGKLVDSRYDLENTPSKDVLTNSFYFVEKNLKDKYPDDSFINNMRAEGYIGIGLYDADGDPIGLIAALFAEPIKNKYLAEDLLNLFAIRITNELERYKAEISRKELVEKLENKNKELEQIVYVASHDIRSPLVNIQGFTSELGSAVEELNNNLDDCSKVGYLKSILNEDIKDSLVFIKESVKKIDGLLGGLLRISRLGRAVINYEKINMNQMFEEITSTFEYIIKEKGVQLEIRELPECFGDRIQLNQVFSNIIDNALKYGRNNVQGSINISAEINKNMVSYIVEDNGLGIDENNLEKIFELFFRGDNERGEGLGIGMTIVRKIIERHNGTINVESKKNFGTKFIVTLPMMRGKNEA